MITIRADQLQVGDRLEGQEEVASVRAWSLVGATDTDPADLAEVVVTDTAGLHYSFDPDERVQVARPATV